MEVYLSYSIFLILRYEYIIKNATTPPTIIPAVVSQKANCNRKGYGTKNYFQYKERRKNLSMIMTLGLAYHVLFKIRPQVHAKYTCNQETN